MDKIQKFHDWAAGVDPFKPIEVIGTDVPVPGGSIKLFAAVFVVGLVIAWIYASVSSGKR